MKRFAAWSAAPVVSALLLLPLAGPARALRMAIIAAAASGLVFIVLSCRTRLANRLNTRQFPLSTSFARLRSFLATPRGAALVALLLVIVPLGVNDYYRDILTLTCLYIVLALGLNLIVGQAGLLHLGHVAFYAIGAYTYALLSTRYGVPFWPGLAAGGLAAALFAIFLGAPILRLRGDYFAVVTLGLGEITRIVLNNTDQVTGGPNGIANIGRPVIAGYILSSTLDYYYLILIIMAGAVLFSRRLAASRIGRAWIAIREDETAAEAMGIDTFRLKMLAFAAGSFWAGIAGVFFSAKMAFVSPESFTFSESVLILCMVVLGGIGSIPGIFVGAFLLIALPEMFRDFQDYRMLAFGTALVLMMIFRPQGLMATRSTRGRT